MFSVIAAVFCYLVAAGFVYFAVEAWKRGCHVGAWRWVSKCISFCFTFIGGLAAVRGTGFLTESGLWLFATLIAVAAIEMVFYLLMERGWRYAR